MQSVLLERGSRVRGSYDGKFGGGGCEELGNFGQGDSAGSGMDLETSGGDIFEGEVHLICLFVVYVLKFGL